jgi:hypothetical protein
MRRLRRRATQTAKLTKVRPVMTRAKAAMKFENGWEPEQGIQ